ncbi:hypothetical protein ILYODFUR_036541 [Ilyodon furcidens]|uniref:Uncharacterized protein n=1 Tax=Ilyodon furcidens TaxID=33524 RepID=A0ABV0TQ84_9TELE
MLEKIKVSRCSFSLISCNKPAVISAAVLQLCCPSNLHTAQFPTLSSFLGQKTMSPDQMTLPSSPPSLLPSVRSQIGVIYSSWLPCRKTDDWLGNLVSHTDPEIIDSESPLFLFQTQKNGKVTHFMRHKGQVLA